LTDDEAQFVREILKPVRVGASPTDYKVGDISPVTTVLPFPEPILTKLPKLAAFRFAVDPAGRILIVDRAYRIAAIIQAA